MNKSQPMDVYSYRLPAWHARQARLIGYGSGGRGIRTAIETMRALIDAGLARADGRLLPSLLSMMPESKTGDGPNS